MSKARVKEASKSGCYFITPTIWNWCYIFNGHNCWRIIADSLKYCQQHKGSVDRAEYWKWSSANPDSEIEVVGFR